MRHLLIAIILLAVTGAGSGAGRIVAIAATMRAKNKVLSVGLNSVRIRRARR